MVASLSALATCAEIDTIELELELLHLMRE